MLNIGVIGSGSGSNFESIALAIDEGRLEARVVCVFSDVEEAFILERARRRGLPSEYINMAPFRTKLDGEAQKHVVARLRHYGADCVALAGFMRIIKPGLLEAFPGRILNIHPSLLPAFPGLHAWEQALDYGARITGCTVHFVDAGMDTGPIIVQRQVPIRDEDTSVSLHARIQEQEHLAYPEALQLLSLNTLRLEGRRVLR